MIKKLLFCLISSSVVLNASTVAETVCQYAHPARKVIEVNLTIANHSQFNLHTQAGFWSLMDANQAGVILDKHAIPKIFRPGQKFVLSFPLFVLKKQLACQGGSIRGQNPLNYIMHGLFTYQDRPVIDIWLYAYANNHGQYGRVKLNNKNEPNLLSVGHIGSTRLNEPKHLAWTEGCQFRPTSEGSRYDCLLTFRG